MRSFLVLTLAILVLSTTALTAEQENTSDDACEAMFVQSADGMSYTGSQLKLKGASPYLIYFCDRPVREAGHISWDAFIELGTKGEDSFAKNHPNAAISVFGPDGQVIEAVVELTQQPVMIGNDVVFPVAMLEGEMPQAGGETVIFIDPIGVPISPTSVAGVHRRHRRRAVRHIR